MPKWSNDYAIKITGHVTYKRLLNKNDLIHPARLIDDPDSLADDLKTSIVSLKFNSLAPFEKTCFVTSWSKEYHVILGTNFPKLF